MQNQMLRSKIANSGIQRSNIRKTDPRFVQYLFMFQLHVLLAAERLAQLSIPERT